MDDLDKYKNKDETYTSPRNGKIYKSIKSFRSHWCYAGTTDPESFAKRLKNIECRHCKKEVISSNIKNMKHIAILIQII